jgi:hypothetical protein
MYNWNNGKFSFSNTSTTLFISTSTDWYYPQEITDSAIYNHTYTGNTIYNIRYDDDLQIDLTNNDPIAKQYSWSNMENLTGTSLQSAFYFSENIDYLNTINYTPVLVASKFNLSIPSYANIEGIKVKIRRKSKQITDLQTNNDFAIPLKMDTTEKYYPYIDNILFSNGITTYTSDNLVTIDNNNNPNIITNFDNKAQTLINEQLTEMNEKELDILNETIENGGNYVPFYVAPKGVWSQNNDEIIYYGNSNDLWSNDKKFSPSDINSDNFSVKIQVLQKIFRGYGFVLPGSNEGLLNAWSSYPGWGDSIDKEQYISYLISRIYEIGIKIYYSYSSHTYELIDRNYYNMNNLVKTDDIYFKNEKCLDGICYSYITSINDIYKKSYLTGDNLVINNMYTEYNIIDKYVKNLYQVDIAIDTNIDTGLTYFELDNIRIKPNNLILLMNQDNKKENDIYSITNNYSLQNHELFSNISKSDKAKVYVKSGTYTEKQYFLLNKSNGLFPIINEEKEFVEAHSYLLKHKINYNINNTNTATTYDYSGNTISNPCKILFTNYNLARTLNNLNSSLYNNINLTLNYSTLFNKINLKYLNTDYIVTDLYGSVSSTTTGNTNFIDYIFNESGNTIFHINSNFYNISNVNDYINIKIYSDININDNNILLNVYTTIKNKYLSNYIIINTVIPEYILNVIYSGSTMAYSINNLQYCARNIKDLSDTLNKSPYNLVIDTEYSSNILNIHLNENLEYYKYFDFSLFNIDYFITGSTTGLTSYTFTTNNQYINYNLKDFINRVVEINDIYNYNYLLQDEYSKHGKFYEIYGWVKDGNINEYQDPYLIIIPNTENKYKLSFFKKYTYVNIGELQKQIVLVDEKPIEKIVFPPVFTTCQTGRTMIYDITDDYMIIEKPANFTMTNFDIVNAYTLQDISNILYDVYTNYEHDYYLKKADNIKNNICNSYAAILKDNLFVRNNFTGIIYGNDNDKYNLDIFNMNVDKNYNNVDKNLTYQPVELIDIGIDKISKLPYPIEINNLEIPVQDSTWTKTYDIYKFFNEPLNMISAENRYITLYNGNLVILGNWNNGICGQTFNSSNFNDPATNFTNKTCYVYFLTTGGTEIKFYTIKRNWLSNKQNDLSQQIKIYNKPIIFDDKLYVYGRVNPYSSTLDVISINIMFPDLLSGLTYSGANGGIFYAEFLINPNSNLVENVHTYPQSFNNATRHFYLTDNDIKFENDKKYLLFNGYNNNSLAWYNYIFDNYSVYGYPGEKRYKYFSVLLNSSTANTASWGATIYTDISNTLESGCRMNKLAYDDNYIYVSGEFEFSNSAATIKISGSTYGTTSLFTKFVNNKSIGIISFNKTNGILNWYKKYDIPFINNSCYFKNSSLIYYNDYIYWIFSYNNTILIDGTTYSSLNENNTIIIKYNNGGDIIWVKEIKGDNVCYNTLIKDDILYLVGIFTNIMYFSNTLQLYSTGLYSSYILKMDINNGDVIGAKSLNSDRDIQINDLELDDNYIYICGIYKGNVYFDDNFKSYNYYYPNSYFGKDYPNMNAYYGNGFVHQIKINSF